MKENTMIAVEIILFSFISSVDYGANVLWEPKQ